MSNDESKMDSVKGEAKAILGCGLQTIAILVGSVLMFALIFAIGMWIVGWFGG